MITVGGLNHVTLCCSYDQLKRVQDFYEQLIGLKVGPRPSFAFPGIWLYAGNEPIVHLAVVLDDPIITADSSLSGLSIDSVTTSSTGAIDHIALRMNGPVDECRKNLVAFGIHFTEAPVPDFPLYQLFLRDPLGVKLELNFEISP